MFMPQPGPEAQKAYSVLMAPKKISELGELV